MQAAMTAVKDGMLVKKAAEEHGVPTTTLRDQIRGSVVLGTKAALSLTSACVKKQH